MEEQQGHYEIAAFERASGLALADSEGGRRLASTTPKCMRVTAKKHLYVHVQR